MCKVKLERGSGPISVAADEFAAFLGLDQSKWAKLIKETKVAVQQTAKSVSFRSIHRNP